MKTEAEIREDMAELIHEAKVSKKRKPNTDKYIEMIKIV